LLNLLLVPWLAHAGLAWSIGLAALVNAGWLWWGLRRQGRYQPAAGWGRFVLQVAVGCVVLAVWLRGCAQTWDWTGLQAQPWVRVGWMAVVLAGSAVLYFGTLRLCGLPLRKLWRQ
jgi:putative peptidoglycan lipid II flippase